MAKFDELDLNVLHELVRDSSQSVPKLSKKIGVNTSVVYSRIKRLVKRKLIQRFTVEVNEELLGYAVSAFVGVNVDAKKRDKAIEGLREIPEVREICEVTGRFDFLVHVKTRSLEQLHGIVSEKIGLLDGVTHTETFITMKEERRIPTYELPKS